MPHIPSSWMRPRMVGGAFDSKKIREKAPFMASVIGLVVVQLLLTFFIMEKLSGSSTFYEFIGNNQWFFVLLIVIPLVIIFILALIPMSMYAKLLLFTLFSLSFGVMLTIIRRFATPEMMQIALLVAIGIFISMFIVGLFLAGFGYDLFWLGIFLFVALIFLLIMGIMILFIKRDQKVFPIHAILVVILFSIYVIYDTNQIIMRDYHGDYVTAGIDYYLDFMNIFVYLLEILGNR